MREALFVARMGMGPVWVRPEITYKKLIMQLSPGVSMDLEKRKAGRRRAQVGTVTCAALPSPPTALHALLMSQSEAYLRIRTKDGRQAIGGHFLFDHTHLNIIIPNTPQHSRIIFLAGFSQG
jgi:hypothetical protein